jgi:protoporphyrinogen oxidase
MNIAIIGGGVTGMGAAFYLARAGHAVTLYEKESEIGGLARSMPLAGGWVERYYHFIMTADTHLLDMIRAVGVEDQLNWVETETVFFANGRMYDFGPPTDLLKFSAIGPLDRLRFIGAMAYLAKFSSWQAMERVRAAEFLPKWAGRRAWDVIFKPMFGMKFGDFTSQMTMAWMWARTRMIKQYRDKGIFAKEKRAWIKGSFKTFLDAAERWYAANGVRVVKDAEVERLLARDGRCEGVVVGGEEHRFDRVLFCAPSPALEPMLRGIPEATDAAFGRIAEQRYFGVTCIVMALARPLSGRFWTYVSDPRVPFVGVIDYASFTRHDGADGQNVIYIPCYSLPERAPYTTPDEQLLADTTRGLKIVFPDFDASQILEARVVRDPAAAMVCTGRYSERIPALKTPLKDLFFANMSQIYPQDRGVNVGIKLAEYAAEAVEKDAEITMDFAPY